MWIFLLKTGQQKDMCFKKDVGRRAQKTSLFLVVTLFMVFNWGRFRLQWRSASVGWGKTTRTLVPWRQGFRQSNKEQVYGLVCSICTGWSRISAQDEVIRGVGWYNGPDGNCKNYNCPNLKFSGGQVSWPRAWGCPRNLGSGELP